MNILSLFDGMSCGRIAAERAGFNVENYYASELDKYAITVTQANWPNTIQLGDVTKWREWDIDWASIDLLIGGSPCQGFSFAGKQLAFDDPRSMLFFVYVDILNHIRSVNPDVKFMLENVKMKKEFLAVITDTMRVDPVFINSNLVSAQNRQRWYWTDIGEIEQPEDKGIMLIDILENEPFDKTIMSDKFITRNKDAGCLRDDVSGKAKSLSAMEYVKNGRQGDYISCGQMIGRRINPVTGKRDDTNQSIKPVQRLELRSDGKTSCLSTVAKDNYVFRDKSKTIRVGGRGSPPCSKQNWDNALNSKSEYRKLTPIECERLQTVPDNYTNHVSNTQRYKMLGNGWTCDVIACIFKQMPIEK